jgi:chromosomal replication initiation ATPase DnaA
MPSPRRHQQHAIAPTAGLARAALTAVLSGGDVAIGQRLIVIVAPHGERVLADLGVDVHDAATLARRLAAAEARAIQERLRDELLAPEWLAIAGIDRIGRTDRQRVIAALLDAVADRGRAACVTMALPPAAAAVDPMLESRLSSGLVVTLPASETHGRATPGATSVPMVIRTTARVHDVEVSDIVGQSRQRSIVRCRSIAMYVARVCTASSLETIGRAFGGRDHTTAMRSVRSVERQLAGDPSLAADVRGVIAALGATGTRSRKSQNACRISVGSPVEDRCRTG